MRRTAGGPQVVLALAVGLLGCATAQQRRAATTMHALSSGKAIVVVSTSADESCRVNTTYLAIAARGGGWPDSLNINNAYEKSDFEDRFGTFDAFVVAPGVYSLRLRILGSLEYTNPFIGTFQLQPGDLKYIGDVHAAGCNGFFGGGGTGVRQGDEWASVKPRLARRFPGLDADRVRVELFVPEPGIEPFKQATPSSTPPAPSGTPDDTSTTAPARAPVAQFETRPPELMPGEEPPRRPIWNVALVLGFAGGGDDLVIAQSAQGNQETLHAGTGLTFAASVGRGLFGNSRQALFLALEGGVKGWDIGNDNSNYHVQLIRFPFIPQLRYLYGQSPGARLLVAAGPQYEIGLHLSGSGPGATIDSHFDHALGGMAEAGVMLEGTHGNVTLSLRYTRITYRGADLAGDVDANSIGVFMNLAWTTFQPISATP